MADPNEADLDERIGRLVARVVDRTPPMQDLDAATLGRAPEPSESNGRRWVPAVAAASVVALAVAGAIVVVGRDGDDVGSATDPTIDPTNAASITDPEPTRAPTTPVPPVARGDLEPMIAVVTGDSVSVRDPSTGVEIASIATRRFAMDEGPTIAIPVGDGRVVVGAFGAIEVWDTSTGDITPFFGPGGSLSGYPFPEDVAVIDGTIWVLYTLRILGGDDDGAAIAYARPLDGAMDETVEVGVTAELQDIGVSRLSLASNGLVIGTVHAGRQSKIVLAVPGTDAERLLAEHGDPDLGPPGPTDCDFRNGCPDSFAAASDGRSAAWTEDGELVIRSLWTGDLEESRTRIVNDAPFGYLDLLDDASVLVVPDDTRTDDITAVRLTREGDRIGVYPGAITVTGGPSLPPDLAPEVPDATAPDPQPTTPATGEF